MRLVLRRAVVLDARACDEGAEQRLVAEIEGGGEREAICDTGLHGLCRAGDEVVLNTQASELELGSGGFDIVHVNLTRGLGGAGEPGAHVMKLNYTSLQHAVSPVEEADQEPDGTGPLAACLLHGQLAPVAWAFSQSSGGARLGLVQGAGGALPGNHSHTVTLLRRDGLLAGFITAAPSFGGELEAMTVAGALAHGFGVLRWDAAVCAPGPGIIGSASRYGNGALAAADALNVGVALGCPGVLVPRLSDNDPRERHRGLSHHTLTVAGVVPDDVMVAWPAGREPEELAGLSLHEAPADVQGYAASGLPANTMGRSIGEEPSFFAAALAAGTLLAGMARG